MLTSLSEYKKVFSLIIRIHSRINESPYLKKSLRNICRAIIQYYSRHRRAIMRSFALPLPVCGSSTVRMTCLKLTRFKKDIDNKVNMRVSSNTQFPVPSSQFPVPSSQFPVPSSTSHKSPITSPQSKVLPPGVISTGPSVRLDARTVVRIRRIGVPEAAPSPKGRDP